MSNILNIFVVLLSLWQLVWCNIEGQTWINDRFSTEDCIDDVQDAQYCREIWDPVCGFDMVTYPSCCLARVSGIKYVMRGLECPSQHKRVDIHNDGDEFEFLLDQDDGSAQMKKRRRLQQQINNIDLDFISEEDILKYFPNATRTLPINGYTVGDRKNRNMSLLLEEGDVSTDKLEIIIGDEDTRVQVPDTTNAPYKYVGRIDEGCTGSLIGTRYVLTAAHCIISKFKGQLDKLNFAPGKNGAEEPFGKFEWFEAYVPQEWKETKNSSSDLAVIVYKQRISDVVGGYLGFEFNCAKEFYTLNIIGYPSDVRPQEQQYVTACQEVQLLCGQDVILHTCDTFAGMSGAPMITYKEDANPQFNIKSIHTGGNTQLQKNFGTNINPSVKAEIENYIQYAEENLAEALDTLFSNQK